MCMKFCFHVYEEDFCFVHFFFGACIEEVASDFLGHSTGKKEKRTDGVHVGR